MTLHHIVSDGWSVELLKQELTTLYQAYAAAQPSPLPELPIQYVDFAARQQRWPESVQVREQLSYWRHQLAGPYETLRLPFDRPRPTHHSFEYHQINRSLAPPLVEALRELGYQQRATHFMTIVAALDVLLYSVTGQTDIRVGTLSANRSHVEIERLIGLFIELT